MFAAVLKEVAGPDFRRYYQRLRTFGKIAITASRQLQSGFEELSANGLLVRNAGRESPAKEIGRRVARTDNAESRIPEIVAVMKQFHAQDVGLPEIPLQFEQLVGSGFSSLFVGRR